MSDQRKPDWLKKDIDYQGRRKMGKLLRSMNLHTVCEEAFCPNQGECFKNRTATFMILGSVCTRNCAFCGIYTGKPDEIDPEEPKNILKAAQTLKLKHIVITSVTRDDLEDGGAGHFADCVKTLKESGNYTVEVLIPDFKGDKNSLDIVIQSKPDIINHNTETVPALYSMIRPAAIYERSLEVLEYVKSQDAGIITKSGFMLGLGEKNEEVKKLIDDLAKISCDMLTIGQYLPPSKEHAALKEYVKPEVFKQYEDYAKTKGIKFVASGPFVRSSYHAENWIEKINYTK